MVSLPFVDVLYIRCDWRNVQKRPGRLDLDPMWDLTMAAAKEHGMRVAFRIQMSNTAFQPDLMQYGFWGEGHNNDYPSPFPDFVTAQRTFVSMTQRQLELWSHTPVAVQTQPDISNVGNREVLAMAMRSGAWLRSDSIIVEEPIQIDQLANRPPHLAAILKDGTYRTYDSESLKVVQRE